MTLHHILLFKRFWIPSVLFKIEIMNIQNKLKMLDFSFYKHAWWDFFWVYKNAFHGSGLEFSELIEYQYGDTIKNIDWNASAKKWKMYTKKFHEERNMNILFVMDVGETMNFWSQKRTKNDIQEELFYTLALSAIHNWDHVGAFLYDTSQYSLLPFGNGFDNIIHILQKKEDMKNNNISLSQIKASPLEHLKKLHLKNTLIFFLNDSLIFEKKDLKVLKWHNQLIYINIFDYFENFLSPEYMNISLESQWKVLDILTLSHRRKTQYITLRKERIENFKQELHKNRISYLYTDTKTNIYTQLFLFFAKIKY